VENWNAWDAKGIQIMEDGASERPAAGDRAADLEDGGIGVRAAEVAPRRARPGRARFLP
jgi:hypothetical protein